MIRKILGCIFVGLPFIGMFIYGAKDLGIKCITLIFLATITIVLLMVLGMYLIMF